MKGIIFNLAEEVITDHYSEDEWEALLDSADVDGAYTALGNYPDEELTKIVSAASARLGVPETDVLRELGQGAFPRLAARYPVFVEPHRDCRGLLLTLNAVIHAEVRKLYPDVDVPMFGFDESDPEVLTMTYQSRRRLCALAEGFIRGAARHFGEHVDIDQPECMLSGDDRCVIRCRFSGAGPEA